MSEIMPQTELETIRKKIADLDIRLTTCSGEECKLINEQMKTLKTALDASIAEQVKAALDSRFDPLVAKLTDLDAAVTKGFATKNPPAAPPAPVIPDNAYFTCPEENEKAEVCGAVLDLTKDVCPKCGAKVAWGDTFSAVLMLRNTEKPKE